MNDEKLLQIFESLNEVAGKYSKPPEKSDELLDAILEMTKEMLKDYKNYREQLENYSLTLESHLEELSRTYEELYALFTVTQILTKHMDPYEALEEFLNALVNAIPSKSAGVYLLKDDERILRTLRDDEIWKPLEKFLEESMIKDMKNVIISEKKDEPVEGIENFLCVPVLSGEKLWGYIVMFNKVDGAFYTAGDRKILESAATQLAFSIRNYEYLKERIERERLKEQLTIAKDIQQGLLPKSFPRNEYFEVFAKTIPTIFVGGDYYDVVELKNGDYLFVMADVSGKGIPAALLMSSLRSVLRAWSDTLRSLGEFVQRLNRVIYRDTPDDRFITMMSLILKPKERKLVLCNAGHDPVILVEPNSMIENITSVGIPLGIFDEAEYEEREFNLKPGNMLVLYTDGIVEARNPTGEEYGFERLEDLLVKIREFDSESVVNRIIKNVKDFSASAPQHDDMTVMVIKVK
ncbi:MAG: SpoIIE family protein phosphatase [Thermotogae bacterium]|nr:SpoIIE family protein phosphatase [Thermotogota bacterium]